MPAPTFPRRAALLVPLLVAGLTGCGGPGSVPGAGSLSAKAAQTRVTELVQHASKHNQDDINGFARATAGLGAEESVALIKIEETDAKQLVDTYGWLTFAVKPDGETPDGETPDGRASDQADGPYCFRVGFNYYGKSLGEWGTSEGVDQVHCPDSTDPVTPPRDESIRRVVPDNARQVARDVLSQLPAGTDLPATDEIAAQVASLLGPVDGDFTVAAEPSVFIEGSDVGIGLGGVDDCVLVSRVDGVVGDVYPPRVYLQPGELGCTASTALSHNLRAPH